MACAVSWPVQCFAKRSALRFEFLAYDGGAGAECLQLAAGDFTGERCHAAVGAGVELVGIHELQRLAQGLGDFFRRLDGVVGDVDGTNHHLLATDQLDQLHRHVGVVAFQRDDIDVGLLKLGEGFFVLTPFGAQGVLPVGVGLDAVAVTDVDGGLALEAFDRTLQRGDAPFIHFIEEHVEGWFIELDDVDACRFEFLGFLVEDLGEFPRQLLAALVMAIEEGVDHGHRARQCPLDRLIGLRAQELGIFDEHRLLARDRADHGRHAGLVAITDLDGFTLLEIHAIQVFDEGGDEVLTRLLAIADDVDPGVLLLLQGDAQGILLARDQCLTFEFPGGPEDLRFGEPGRFRQAASGGGRE